MDWQMIGALGESMGAAAVVVSLLYVARQVRFAIQEARIQRRHQLIVEMMKGTDLLAADSELAEIWVRGAAGLAGLDAGERMRYAATLTRISTTFDELHQSIQSGMWPEGPTQDTEAVQAEFAAYPGVREWWETRRTFFGPSFAEHMDRLMSVSKSLPPWIASSKLQGDEPSGDSVATFLILARMVGLRILIGTAR